MEKNTFFQSRTFMGVVLGIGALAVLTFVFCLGVTVGTEKAEFSFKWADQYHKNFGGPQGGFFGDFMGTANQMPNSNGSFGQILKIDGNLLTVKDGDGDNIEKIIMVGNKTTITYQHKNIKLSALRIGDNIVVIGDPNASGQIQAGFIRVTPTAVKSTPLASPIPTTPKPSL